MFAIKTFTKSTVRGSYRHQTPVINQSLYSLQSRQFGLFDYFFGGKKEEKKDDKTQKKESDEKVDVEE